MTITRLDQYSAETQEFNSFQVIHREDPVISSAQAKTGTYSYAITINDGLMGYAHDTGLTQVRMGYWLRHNGLFSNNQALLFRACNGSDDTSASFELNWNASTTTLSLDIVTGSSGTRGSVHSVTAPANIAEKNNWKHIGIDYKIDSSAGWLYFYLDGIQIIGFDGDTRPGYWDGAQQHIASAPIFNGPGPLIEGNSGFDNTAYMDNMYIDNTAGEVSPALPPALEFLYSPVNGPGTNSDFTGVGSATNWENVDELPPNGDTDYNEALSAGLVDSFAHAGVTIPANYTFHAAIPLVFARNVAAGPQIRLKMFDGVNTANGADQDLDFDYNIPRFERFTTQPDGSAWDEASFNSMETGYESRPTFA